MAQQIRFGIFLLSVIGAAVAFFGLHGNAAWLVALAVFVAGSALAELAFNRLATLTEKQRDLEDRVRNPPA